MKLHFDQLFAHQNDQIFPKSDVTSSGVFYRKGEGVSDTITIFGVSYAALLNHDFEVTAVPEDGYEIKAYYVR